MTGDIPPARLTLVPRLAEQVLEVLQFKRKTKDEAPPELGRDFSEWVTVAELADALREDYLAVVDACNWLCTYQGCHISHAVYPPTVCAPPERFSGT